MRIFILSIFTFNLLFAEFYTLERLGKAEAYVFTYLKVDARNPLQSYLDVVLRLPDLLEHVSKQETKKVLLAIPKNLSGRSPLDKDAALYEGARVALSWVSAYARFEKLGNLDVRVLLCETGLDADQLCEKLTSLAQKEFSFKNDQTPEEKMALRCIEDNNQIIMKHTSCLKSLNTDKFSKTEFNIFPPFSLPPLIEGKKRFVITGGAGFIGVHLVQRLLSEGHQVIVLDNGLCCDARNFDLLAKYKNCYVVRYDITKPFFVSGHVDWVIHLASVPSPVFYYNLPVETLKTGLNGTINCMDLALNTGAKFLFASTSEVYGDPEIHPQPETYVGNVSPIGKRSQYDQSKRGGETLIKLYVEKRKLDARMVRIFNTYGPYMRLQDGRVITSFVESIFANKPFRIYGDGTQSRSFSYVSDTVDGIVRLINHEFKNNEPIEQRVFNVGNQAEMSINQLASVVHDLALKMFNKQIGIVYEPQIDVTDPNKRCPDLTRSSSVLGYEPKVNPLDGIAKTINYFLPDLNGDLNGANGSCSGKA
ncbi:TPA: hypothetical protein DIC20_01150 [Candidatus Dependentiae bacterium]|nr:MAG: NAD-dependent epimerase/dehydratase family protein [candidate division TM6 bacterium GW2011_GWF2_36_131]KKQ03594.1 MAG: NAD-dependent epimerase/dehydratase family protein [candidate division TM6 bacterium GW2011_GWE2_36_25]KKQ20129.1 MAG: NAD-dependent epimerase/dehydratase family protein [candidate division TM6 bacterium GW2011_GWA2_36_9]HBR70672.1 hypothetical protein [Candidatus Dependentiae bacterium]HCU00292.1 hypothetical protein [Candidatus Dependentiae bacterium]